MYWILLQSNLPYRTPAHKNLLSLQGSFLHVMNNVYDKQLIIQGTFSCSLHYPLHTGLTAFSLGELLTTFFIESYQSTCDQ